MKRLNLIYVIGLLLLMNSCEKSLPTFLDEECFLIFNYGAGKKTDDATITENTRRGSHSFVLNSAEGQECDTVWLKVNTLGKLSSESRPLTLVQLQDTSLEVVNAVPGEHYIAFDDPSLAGLYHMPGDSAVTQVPVVVLCPFSLKQNDVVLKITFGDNGYFKAGYPEFATYTLTISNQLTPPDMWNEMYMMYDFGEYGPKKHELMIRWTGNAWDDEYIKTLCYEGDYGWSYKDSAYIGYLRAWFQRKLAEENAIRLDNGEDVYREADGTEVNFDPIPWY